MLCAVVLGCVFCSREATFDVHPWQLEVPSQQRRFKTVIDKREAWTVRGGLSNPLFQFLQVPLALQVEGPFANLAYRGYGNRELLNGQVLMAAGEHSVENPGSIEDAYSQGHASCEANLPPTLAVDRERTDC